MNHARRVLLPIDGSDIAMWGLGRAGRLLERPGSEAMLLTVIPVPSGRAESLAFQADPRHEATRAMVATVQAALLKRNIPTERTIRFGDPAREILDEMRSGSYQSIVMATHGRPGPGRILSGSVAARVLQESPLPVILFRPALRPDGGLSPLAAAEPAEFHELLVMLDGSQEAEEILPAAEDLALAFRSRIHLFTAVADDEAEGRNAREYLLGRAHLFEAIGFKTAIEVRAGDPAEQALAYLREAGLDGVAMTTHGRTGLARALYGSVAERMLAAAPVPVLLVRNRTARITGGTAQAERTVEHV